MRTIVVNFLLLVVVLSVAPCSSAWQQPQQPKPTTGRVHHKNELQHQAQQPQHPDSTIVSRRNALTQGSFVFLLSSAAAAAIVFPTNIIANAAGGAPPNGLPLNTSPSGLKWADAKIGTGQPLEKGMIASIDYSMASTAGRVPQIYSNKDSGSPYRWKLGDGTTIAGIEMAILGDTEQGIPPMVPGSIRRVIVPESLGYVALIQEKNNAKYYNKCLPEDHVLGPIPPKDGSGAYQRWYQFYCNPRIPYQPDLVLDIKLYGKR